MAARVKSSSELSSESELSVLVVYFEVFILCNMYHNTKKKPLDYGDWTVSRPDIPLHFRLGPRKRMDIRISTTESFV